LIVKFNVLVSGHPEALVLVEVYVPLEVYVCPFADDQVYVSQAVSEADSEVLLLMVNTNVSVIHPTVSVISSESV
jgi:tRNA G10  N-methylase Trm11